MASEPTPSPSKAVTTPSPGEASPRSIRRRQHIRQFEADLRNATQRAANPQIIDYNPSVHETTTLFLGDHLVQLADLLFGLFLLVLPLVIRWESEKVVDYYNSSEVLSGHLAQDDSHYATTAAMLCEVVCVGLGVIQLGWNCGIVKWMMP